MIDGPIKSPASSMDKIRMQQTADYLSNPKIELLGVQDDGYILFSDNRNSLIGEW